MYLKEFHLAMNDYRRVVKALTVFIYLGATDTDRNQGTLRSDYRDIMKQNDSKRKSLENQDVQALGDVTERVVRLRELGRELIQRRPSTDTANGTAFLEVSRVA